MSCVKLLNILSSLTSVILQIPVICICNDRQSTKVKSLVNYCYDMKFRRCVCIDEFYIILNGNSMALCFRRPDANMIRSRVMTIACREKLKLSSNAVDALVAATRSDIRQVINILSTYKLHNDVL